MRVKLKKTIFACQIADTYLRVIKFAGNNNTAELTGIESEALPPNIDDQVLTGKIKEVFDRLAFNNEPVIISLSSNNVTSRYLKIPAYRPEEIEKIVSLQASKYLPYPDNELIIGYQVISIDAEGYAYINLIIVHKDVIQRYVGLFKQLKARKLIITLGSYGLRALYSHINPKETGMVTVMDINAQQAELAIISGKQLLFNRNFKYDRSRAGWESLFIEEIRKTQDAYVKESGRPIQGKIIIFGPARLLPEFAGILNKNELFPAEITLYDKKLILSDKIRDSLLNSDNSFAAMIGLCLEGVPDPLNLMPFEIKQADKSVYRRKENLRLGVYIFSIFLMAYLGMAKNTDNKAYYLGKLKAELNKMGKEAKPLEAIEDKFKLLESRSKKKVSSLEILYEIYQIVLPRISLTNFVYDEDELVLRGQTPELNSIFGFVTALEKSPVFQDYSIKVRYATKKDTQTGEVIDFEISGLKVK